jgi:hypothetical protein
MSIDRDSRHRPQCKFAIADRRCPFFRPSPEGTVVLGCTAAGLPSVADAIIPRYFPLTGTIVGRADWDELKDICNREFGRGRKRQRRQGLDGISVHSGRHDRPESHALRARETPSLPQARNPRGGRSPVLGSTSPPPSALVARASFVERSGRQKDDA